MSADLPSSFKFDYDVCINVRILRNGKETEEPLFTHRVILAAASSFLKNLLLAAPVAPIAQIELDLRLVPNGLEALKAVLVALYTGEVKITENVQPTQMLCVARLCQIPSVESKILSASLETNPLMFFLQQQSLFANLPVQNYVQSVLTAMYLQQQSLSEPQAAPSLLTSPSSTEDSNSRISAESSPRISSPMGEKVLPMDDKDGWCRNKKYIEKVDNGFMCIVCRKIYGRYNSVSYHVTIYHRNPPIKCDLPGCQFSTREARYIHFHKYYRHHTPLPESIDLGSRKCPYCRHVSKSPAMLLKHMARHQQADSKDVSFDCLDSWTCQIDQEKDTAGMEKYCRSLKENKIADHIKTIRNRKNFQRARCKESEECCSGAGYSDDVNFGIAKKVRNFCVNPFLYRAPGKE